MAKIIYVGPTGHATYKNGLALALTDEGQMAWPVAMRACDSKNTSTPVTGATWLLASRDQWDYMLGANGAGSYTALRDGFSGISGASNLQSGYYWSSSKDEYDEAWCYDFGNGNWGYTDYLVSSRVRACLAFLAQETVTLNHSANNTWAIAEMPAGDVELEVEYFNITVPTANTADIYIGTTTPLINAGSTTEDGATMKYLVTATNEQPTSTDGFSADVPTAEGRTAGTYYVWYYLDFATGADSDISALAVEVTVKAYAITVKEGTEDATSWQVKAGTGEYQALPLEGVALGTAVSVKYSGRKLVKSVNAKKKATAKDKGKLICTDGHIHAYGEDAECTKARVAKIIYVSPTGHATYTPAGLALALTDEDMVYWDPAMTACNNKNTSTPVTGATWLLASKDQWDKMITAAGNYFALRTGFSSVGGSNMHSYDYWSSTEIDSNNVWNYDFYDGQWESHGKDDYEFCVRACLAFGALETVTLNHSANNTWAIAEMPAGDVELEVEYFNITVPTANTADIYIGTTTPLINAGSTTEDGATMKYLVTATNEQPTSTDGFSADVPTAQATAITGLGTYYVWYYLDLATGDDSDISALAVEVTVSGYTVTMKEGTLDATSWQGKAGTGEYQALPLTDLEPGTAVTVKYNGTKLVKSVKDMNHSANNAWAQEETLLTTILSTGDNASFKSGSKTFDNKATVTFSGNVYNDDDETGWYSDEERTLTVTAAENYTITRVKFYTDEGSGFDEEAPFEAILVNDGGIITKVNGTKIGIGGVTKIMVYGYANIVNHSANNTWAIAEMPDGGVELEVEYFNITVPTANTADIYIGTTTPLINAGSTTEDGATMKYLVTATNEQPTSTDGFSTDVPTALPLTGPGTYYVWYYLDFATGADSDISALAVEVTVSFHVTMKEGTLDADNWQGKAGEGEYQALPLTGLEAGTAVSVKYSGTKKVKSVKAVKAAPALNLTSPAVGQVIGKDGKNYDYASLPGGVTAVAKICYVSGSNGLALALTDEGEMNWESAVTTAAAHTPVFSNATWKLATKDEWNNMITAAGGYTALRDGFRGITGASNLRSTTYWSSTESGSDNAWSYFFGNGIWLDVSKGYAGYSVRACLAFGAQGSDPIDLTPSADGTVWTLAATPAFDVELEVEYETALALSETTDNTAALTEWDGYEADVTLTRTLAAGSYNTFAAPFSTAIPSGWTVKELSSTSFADGTLTLKFATATSIEAGKPYLVKVAANTDLSTAPFTGVIVSKDAQPFTSTDVDFIPTLGATTIEGSDTKAVLFLEANNTLLNPSALPANMKGFRAYFLLKGAATSARSFNLNLGDEATGIKAIDNGQLTIDNDRYYDLQGRRISKATQKGVYIQNGKKVVIK